MGGDDAGGMYLTFLRSRLNAALTMLRSSHQWLRGRLYCSSNIGGRVVVQTEGWALSHDMLACIGLCKLV